MEHRRVTTGRYRERDENERDTAGTAAETASAVIRSSSVVGSASSVIG